MNKQENARADLPVTELKSAMRASAPKFIQRRGERGFNNQPRPTHLPHLTPTPPAPKWRVPVEKAKG